jgi:glycosyltransferase involved in cell wall biosynthesis
MKTIRTANDEKEKEKARERTYGDKVISFLNAMSYAIMEPPMLRAKRIRYGHLYKKKEENPLISVYVPTYNRAEILLERAVPTVLNQTYRNFELIVVGDCCTDDTEELLSKIKDPRLKFYNLTKRGKRYPATAENHWLAGPVVPANKGLELVVGKWIARIDDDDTWTPDHLESLLNFAQEGDLEFVSASYETERYGKRYVVSAKDDEPQVGGTQTWLYRGYLKFFKYNINCWRKSWNRVNDVDLQDRIWKAGVKIGYWDRVLAYVLPRPGEDTVGLDAYKKNRGEKEDHYKF